MVLSVCFFFSSSPPVCVCHHYRHHHFTITTIIITSPSPQTCHLQDLLTFTNRRYLNSSLSSFSFLPSPSSSHHHYHHHRQFTIIFTSLLFFFFITSIITISSPFSSPLFDTVYDYHHHCIIRRSSLFTV